MPLGGCGCPLCNKHLGDFLDSEAPLGSSMCEWKTNGDEKCGLFYACSDICAPRHDQKSFGKAKEHKRSAQRARRTFPKWIQSSEKPTFWKPVFWTTLPRFNPLSTCRAGPGGTKSLTKSVTKKYSHQKSRRNTKIESWVRKMNADGWMVRTGGDILVRRPRLPRNMVIYRYIHTCILYIHISLNICIIYIYI